MNMKVSVIIPFYNVEKYLKRCIESILIQEWKNYDILLVDDGSTDNSKKIRDYHRLEIKGLNLLQVMLFVFWTVTIIFLKGALKK